VTEGSELHLEEFPVDETLAHLKAFDPIVTTGTRYRIDEISHIAVERTLEVRMNVAGCRLSMRELEVLDFDELGYDVSDRVGLLLAIYRIIRSVPISR
jgi:hypothetical protein